MSDQFTASRDLQVVALFACCVPVQGARRSVICDLQRQTFRLIPSGLFEILTEHRGKTIAGIKAAYDNEFDDEIDGYFDFLVDNELAFFCDADELDDFPPVDLSWERPERISNAIIDVDGASNHDYPRIFRELDDLGCRAVELRFFHSASLVELGQVLYATRSGRLRAIDIVVGWSDDLAPEALEALATQNPRIQSVVVHSSPKTFVHTLANGVNLHYRCEVIDSPACCGQVHSGYFVSNIAVFTEAQRYNTCLNRKISIDSAGEIKNCPSMVRSFGNIRQASLHSVVANRDFTELWEINKDQIEICKDCEFRYICTDCRAYLSEPGNVYSKPAKCSYNPYTATWGGRGSE